MQAVSQRLDRRDRALLGQLVRFGVTGVAVTLFYSAVYWPIATYGHRVLLIAPGAAWPLIGVAVAFVAATAVGNVAHSRISFKGHGTRDQRTAHRFALVQGFGFGLNLLFTWMLTGPLLHWPTWTPLVPAVAVVPLATFWLQRNWVFR